MSKSTGSARALVPYHPWPGHMKTRWVKASEISECWIGVVGRTELDYPKPKELRSDVVRVVRPDSGLWLSRYRHFGQSWKAVRAGQEHEWFEITAEAAARWFAANEQDPPEILLSDLERHAARLAPKNPPVPAKQAKAANQTDGALPKPDQEWIAPIEAHRLAASIGIKYPLNTIGNHRKKGKFQSRPGGAGTSYEVERDSFDRWARSWDREKRSKKAGRRI
jgi:hypothetical protein